MTELTPPLSAEDHVDGPDRAELELVMYGDFQCPYCTAAYPIVRRVRDQLAGRLLFAFRHFPLRDVHPDAERAAQAAEAAAAQGAFWQMHDKMYESRGALSREDLISHAREVGLDADRVSSELDSELHAPRVQRDLDSGLASGVRGTPTFFAGGRVHRGSFDASSLITALEASGGP
ncbi:MAG TPA: thioredoxin domain-containing protein [Solirubrobacterales bacterium]|nr:thioredoxin domain-containing protein [Solirubrobacterales bacterium]